jgi:hypothetical protein
VEANEIRAAFFRSSLNEALPDYHWNASIASPSPDASGFSSFIQCFDRPK